MICRLCLCDLDNSVSVYIFSAADHELPKVIAKYLQLEVTLNDNISNRLCTQCWRCLNEFEQFCAMVAEKQQMLLKTEPEPPPEPAVIVWNTESPIESKLAYDDTDADVKDHILCEPEIDVHDGSQMYDKRCNNAGGRGSSDNDDDDGGGGDNSSNSSSSCDAFADAFVHVSLISTETAGGGTAVGAAAAGGAGAAATTASTTTAARLQRSKAKTRLKQTAAKHKTELPAASNCTSSACSSTASTAITNNLRASRARSREQRRNTAAQDTSPLLLRAVTKSTSSAVKTGKRGRPKGKKNQSVLGAAPKVKCTKMDAPQLAAKRSSIKEMDDYIAANVKLDCCLCAAPLQDFVDLKRHFRVAHDCTGYMQCCNNRYKKRTLYVDHLHYHKDPQYFSCQPCHKSFLNRNSQDMHMLRFHSDQQQLVHQCAICEARFAKKFLLTMHIKGHRGTERTEACETCSKTFRSKIELTAHIKRMHTSDFAPVICDICGAHFRSKANFLTHKKALHPEGPVEEVQCQLCSRWLRDERSLRKHLARHDDREGNNKYRCLLCGAEKASRVALSSHMRYHHSNKRHSCTLCGKEFKLSRSLAEHMATHTGIDLYSCQFCTRTFKSHANMHNHKKKMHPNEWVRKYTQPSGVINGVAGGMGAGAVGIGTVGIGTVSIGAGGAVTEGLRAGGTATEGLGRGGKATGTAAETETTPITPSTVANAGTESCQNAVIPLDSPLEYIEEGTQQTLSDASGNYEYLSSNGNENNNVSVAVCPL